MGCVEKLDREKQLSIIVGVVLLIVGVFVLSTVFSYASGIINDPQGKLNEFVDEKQSGPTASFQWYSSNETVEFYDYSSEGDTDIVYYRWDFGDGRFVVNETSPIHNYKNYGNYTVTLTVEDENGENDSIKTKVSTQKGSDSGQALKGFDVSILELGGTLRNMLVVGLLIGGLAILVLIGGKILLTGARLIRPTSETLKVKSKNGVVLDVTSEKEKKKSENVSEKDKTRKEEKSSDKEEIDKEINDFLGKK